MLKPVAFVALFKGTIESPCKYPMFDLKAKDLLALVKRSCKSLLSSSKGKFKTENYFQNVSLMSRCNISLSLSLTHTHF